ncbi:alpha/beta hydrolase family protein [Streptomyces bottropensis]|uniref:alpha/beta hydrolase family protein n=1 Tax=Streptomyces bottropensis TaxID=42235 RepID=UPI003678A94B
MIRVSRVVAAVTAALTVALVVPGTALAAPEPEPGRPSAPASPGLPEGWLTTGSGESAELVWRAPEKVPVGDAQVEFRSGERLLGTPRPAADGRTFRLPLDGVRLGSTDDLRVEAAGRRLDVAGAKAAARERRELDDSSDPSRLPRAATVNEVDPGVPGSFRTTSGEYSLPSVHLPGYDTDVEMKAVVVAPEDAPGSRPLALFLHGRHSTCFKGDDLTLEWPCPSDHEAVPSYRGYLHDQQLLASQGYVTVSISANSINAQDWQATDAGAQARSSLIRLHLAHWADWAADPSTAPEAVRRAPGADLGRVLLVGHSRGGEGADRAALDSLAPPPADKDGYHGETRWTIRGTVLIGPTIFGQNPAPDVPSVTILPGCDGDVIDLQGELYVDGTRGVSRGRALHSAVYMTGANHNYFNSEWTPGQATAPADDDFPYGGDEHDPLCSPGTATRLTAEQQQKAGSTYIAAAARLFVAGDDRARPLLDGSPVRAASAGPARVLTHAVGAARSGAFLPAPSATVGGGRLCAQVDPDPDVSCLDPELRTASPHFAQWRRVSPGKEADRYALAMNWSRAGTATELSPARPVSLSGAKSLSLRVIVPPNTTGTELDVALTDTAGRRADLGRVGVDGLPGTSRTSSYWAREVRVPLTAETRERIDLGHVKTLHLTPRTGSGTAWLVDAHGWRPGTPVVEPARLPRVDVGGLTVEEGDSGTRTYQVPVQVSGSGRGEVRLFVDEPGSDQQVVRTVRVRAGTRVDVPVTVEGNTRYGADDLHRVAVKTVRGALVGSYLGGVTAQNDDPQPTVTVTPVADQVTEGRPLVWRISLSAVADVVTWTDLQLLPVPDGTELSTKDVPATWLEETFRASPDPERPLSALPNDALLMSEVPAGDLSIDVSVPTVTDQLGEDTESLRLLLWTYDAEGAPVEGPEFTGTVRDAS